MIFLDFVAVGYQKCGTETLSFLDCHPNIVYRWKFAQGSTDGQLLYLFDPGPILVFSSFSSLEPVQSVLG